jgi:hypothetical protein
VPGVVPGLGVPPPPELPPQPATANPTKINNDASTTTGRRFRAGAKHMSITNRRVAAAPVPTIHRVFGRRLFVGIKGTLAAAVVLTVSVAVPVVVELVKLIGPPTEQVGGSVAPDAVTLHDSEIAPVKPPVPVAVMVEVPD